jgi:hypothetical protein
MRTRLRLFSDTSANPISSQYRRLYGLNSTPRSEDTQGLVLRRLPKHFEVDELRVDLSERLGVSPSDISVYTDIEGKPAYSVIATDDKRVIEKGLSWHKQMYEGSKLRVCVSSKQGLKDFLTDNRPLKGGFDSRKVVILNIPALYSEEDVVKRVQSLGQVMGVYLPKDYEAGLVREVGLSPLDASLIKLEAIDERKVKRSSHNVLSEADRYIKQEADSIISSLVEASEPTLPALVASLNQLWEYVGLLGKRLAVESTQTEHEIEASLTQLKEKSVVHKSDLEALTLRVRQVGMKLLEPYFRNKGFAVVTFATRVISRQEQAARAVVSAPLMFDFRGIAVFYRNQPDYIFNSKALNEAFERRFMHKSFNTHSHTKMLALLKVASHRMENNFRSKQTKLQFFGSDGEEDPVFAGKIKDRYEEALVKQNLDTLRPDRSLRTELLTRKDPYKQSLQLFSSDEEVRARQLFDTDDEIRPQPGRVSDARTQLDYFLAKKQAWIDPKLRSERFKYEDFLRVNPKQLYWSPFSVQGRLSEKTAGLRQISEAEKFFKTAIPSQLKGHPELLTKARYGDAPVERYVFKSKFDYSSMPTEDPILDDGPGKYLRSLVDRLFEQGKAANLAKENITEVFVEEEENYYSKTELKSLSDTDEDLALKESIPEELRYSPDMGEQALKELRMNMMNMMLYLKAQPNPTYVESYIYKGVDIEAHIKEVKEKFPAEVSVEWRKLETGEKTVVISYKHKWRYSLEEVEYLTNKYGDLLAASEAEVDEADLPIIQKIFANFNPKLFEEEMAWQQQAKTLSEALSLKADTEELRNYGSLASFLNQDNEMTESEEDEESPQAEDGQEAVEQEDEQEEGEEDEREEEGEDETPREAPT